MRIWKSNDIRQADLREMVNVPWSVDSGRAYEEDKNPTVEPVGPVQRSEQIPNFLIDEDGKEATGRGSRCKKYTRTSDGILGKIARKESRENEVTTVKVIASLPETKNILPEDTKKIKKATNRGSRPRRPR